MTAPGSAARSRTGTRGPGDTPEPGRAFRQQVRVAAGGGPGLPAVQERSRWP